MFSLVRFKMFFRVSDPLWSTFCDILRLNSTTVKAYSKLSKWVMKSVSESAPQRIWSLHINNLLIFPRPPELKHFCDFSLIIFSMSFVSPGKFCLHQSDMLSVWSDHVSLLYGSGELGQRKDLHVLSCRAWTGRSLALKLKIQTPLSLSQAH